MQSELPGFKKEDISIDINGDCMTVKAERSEEKEEGHRFIRRERYMSSLSRSFDISGIDPENIKASYENGILTLILPKMKEKAPEGHRITVE